MKPRFARPSAVPLRQVHLDFHTSPLIPDVGSEFDASDFARTLKQSRVNSVTIFAKCHHGMCYYPSKTGTIHPAIKRRDILGEMLVALHREGIRAPIYTTVAWDEDVASRHPEWRQMLEDGTFARCNNPSEGKPRQPGGWHFNDWVNPDYQDYIESHIRELCSMYGDEIDGFFFDILIFGHLAHYSEASLKFRKAKNLVGRDQESFKRFEAIAQGQFAKRFSRLIRAKSPRSTIFYNAGFDISVDSNVGGRVRTKYSTHVEIESLPSGFWGYFHFPRLARGVSRWNVPWIGMTGRFQKMWGDFGGIKPQPALEYECFRTQALGGGNSVGDQLHPRGRLDPAAYELIGAVYKQCEAAEAFYNESSPIPEIGIVSANYPGKESFRSSKSDEGAVQMCDEAHYDSALLDDSSDLSGYSLIILPDSVVVTDLLLAKLKAYYKEGGRLLLSHHAGRDREGKFVLNFLPLDFCGDVEAYPTYWRTRRKFVAALSGSDRVVYSQGANVLAKGKNIEILVDRVLPYFKRTDLSYSSHFQTPPLKRASRFPSVVSGRRFVYLADPIFSEYRQVGNITVRDVWARCLERLIGPARFGSGLPTTILCSARRRGKDLILTLLHYIPLRKSLELDVLEERMGFFGEVLRLPESVKAVKVFPTGAYLERDAEGSFILPNVKGRLLLEIPGFFIPR